MQGLTNLLDSEGNNLINIFGQTKDINGNDVLSKLDSDGNKIVYCRSWDGERFYRVIDLVALQFKGLLIPKEDYGKVEAFVIDGDPNNTHAENIGYRFRLGLDSEPWPETSTAT